MTGNGRCQRRRNMTDREADGGCGTDEKPVPLSGVPATNTPSVGDSVCSGADFYSQALKALSERSPFDIPEVLTTTVPTLPSALGSRLLARQSDGRKRHKKSHTDSKSSKQGLAERPKSSSIWVEYEEYFRELTMSDIDMLQKWSTSLELLVSDSCLLIPVIGNVARKQLNSSNVSDAPANVVKQKFFGNEASMHLETVIDKAEEQSMETVIDKAEEQPMEIDDGDCDVLPPVAQESSSPQQLDCLSSLEWVLGSRNKILLTTKRPTKKRKLVGENAGLQRLVIAKSCKEISRVCHFCSGGDTGDQLNPLIVCSSCKTCVHQKCYGVQGYVDESWACSWCKWKSDAQAGGISSGKGSCVLCPKSGGALKPIQGAGAGNGLSMEFAHLFCSLWMPEVYVDDMRMMEPILNVDRIQETRKKLICTLCKVRQGTCVRCTNGACRASFHPICAREAGHRLEVWGKLGCDDVELRAFCSKHSHDLDESQGEATAGMGSSSPPSELCQLPLDNLSENDAGDKRRDHIADCLEIRDDLPDKLTDVELQKDKEGGTPHARFGLGHTKVPKFTDKESQGGRMSEVVNPPDSSDLSLVLKKLIEGEKVSLKELGSDIGVPADSLAASINANHLPPELCCKIIKWLRDHAFIGTSQKKLTVKISIPSKVDNEGDDCSHSVTVKESDTFDVPVKSVPPRKRTISSVRTVKDDNVSPISAGCLKYGDCESMKLDNENVSRSSASVDVAVGIPVHSASNVSCHLTNIGLESGSYVHPFVQKRIKEMSSSFVEKSFEDYDGSVALNSSQLKQSSTNGVCSKRDDQDGSYVDGGRRINLDELIKSNEMGISDLYPEDELEGELVYFQNWLFGHAAKRKRLSDNLICKIVKNLPQELEMVRKRRWDSVLVHQYLHELREAKKQGRKERKYKEAQEILAAATAAAAASSRTSLRKDGIDEASHQQIPRGRVGPPAMSTPRVKETTSSLAVSRNMSDKNLDILHLSAPVSKEHPRFCDICGRPETVWNPILICSSCKVPVHLVCYRNVKESTGPWYCELCEDSTSKGSIVKEANSSDKLNPITQCNLCGTANGALRKTSSGHWVHALCAEWVFDSSFRRGQANPICGMESVVRGSNACSVCHQSFGVCIKCNFGACHTTFHPTCARSAGYYMNVRSVGGKQQRKAYCDKHSIEQREKVEGQKHGVEELKSLKQVRVELEKLRLICERIVKREKLKRELVICSHELLASKKDSLAFSPLFQNPFFPPEASSESATTSMKGQTDCSRSCSTVQKSDDATVDSTVSGKRRIKILVSAENDQRTDDSSTSQQLPVPKPTTDRVSFSGKHLPLRASFTRRNIQETGGKKLKSGVTLQHTETFEKELIMTSDQASMKNQRLPKGYIYVPIDRLSTEEPQTGQDSHGQDH